MINVNTILVPTDFSDPARTALVAAKEVALRFSARIVLAHVVGPIPVSIPASSIVMPDIPRLQKELDDDALKNLEQLSREHLADIPHEIELARGEAPDELVRLADKKQADMIVLSTHGRTGWRHLIFGSVAEKVIRLSPIPVLTIRRPREDEGEIPPQAGSAEQETPDEE